jgi:hypothetical protein
VVRIHRFLAFNPNIVVFLVEDLSVALAKEGAFDFNPNVLGVSANSSGFIGILL